MGGERRVRQERGFSEDKGFVTQGKGAWVLLRKGRQPKKMNADAGF